MSDQVLACSILYVATREHLPKDVASFVEPIESW